MNANNNANTNGTKNSDLSFDEAPASWNTRYISPEGFECQITLRGETGSELLEKAASAIAYLLKNGCVPYIYRAGSRPFENKTSESKTSKEPSNGNGNNDNPAWCSIHDCEMKRWDKDGRVWYSHKVNGEWCKGK